MPIKIPDSLPARTVLESENIFVMTQFRAMHQDIRPLNLGQAGRVSGVSPADVAVLMVYLRQREEHPC